jgi:hypothetical protein
VAETRTVTELATFAERAELAVGLAERIVARLLDGAISVSRTHSALPLRIARCIHGGRLHKG